MAIFVFLLIFILDLQLIHYSAERKREGEKNKQKKKDILMERKKQTHRTFPVMWCNHVSLVSMLGQTFTVLDWDESPPSRWPWSNRWSLGGGGAERSDICHPKLTSHTV